MFLPFSSLCPNSRHMTPQAPHLGHRKPLHGSAPTCFARFAILSRVLQRTFHTSSQALSGRDGAHLSQVQSNCFVLFSDLSRSEAQSESCVEPANPACFLIYLHAAKHYSKESFDRKASALHQRKQDEQGYIASCGMLQVWLLHLEMQARHFFLSSAEWSRTSSGR